MAPRSKGRSREGGRENYQYLPLREAVLRKGDEVNLYGAIREYDQPKPTRGSDYLCTMTIVDVSYDQPGLRLLVFSSASNCPVVKALGDVIRVHRVKMSDYHDSPQAVANINRKSAFILLDGKVGSSTEPYQKSHATFTFEGRDDLILEHMRKWVGAHPLVTGTSAYLVRISGIKANYYDLCCKILYVDNRCTPQRVTIIYVWDGTDALPRAISNSLDRDIDTLQPDVMESKLIPFPLPPRDIMCDVPPIGTLLPIVPEVSFDSLPGQMPQRGDWVKFRNLACRTHAGLLEAVFTRESKISLLSTDSHMVKERESLYQERILNAFGRLPQSSSKPPQSLTATDFEQVQFSTLREVLTHAKVTHKFRCLVRVTATLPTQVRNFCVPLRKAEDKAESESSTDFVYCVSLTLEDPTGRLQALCYGQDGAKFFNGYPPANLCSDSALVGALERQVQKLLGYKYLDDGRPAPEREPAWIKLEFREVFMSDAFIKVGIVFGGGMLHLVL